LLYLELDSLVFDLPQSACEKELLNICAAAASIWSPKFAILTHAGAFQFPVIFSTVLLLLDKVPLILAGS
jgi:hypothetical protein